MVLVQEESLVIRCADLDLPAVRDYLQDLVEHSDPVIIIGDRVGAGSRARPFEREVSRIVPFAVCSDETGLDDVYDVRIVCKDIRQVVEMVQDTAKLWLLIIHRI